MHEFRPVVDCPRSPAVGAEAILIKLELIANPSEGAVIPAVRVNPEAGEVSDSRVVRPVGESVDAGQFVDGLRQHSSPQASFTGNR